MSRIPSPSVARTPLRNPRNGQGTSQGAQVAMDFSTVKTWIDDVYQITREVARDHFGDDALAADVGISRQLMRLKLNREEDSHGDLQRLHLDVLGYIFNDPVARWDWLARFTARCGAMEPVPQNEDSDSVKLKLLLGALDGETGEAILDLAAKKGGTSKAAIRRVTGR